MHEAATSRVSDTVKYLGENYFRKKIKYKFILIFHFLNKKKIGGMVLEKLEKIIIF